MTMKKILFAMALAASVAVKAATTGDYMLYWQVSSEAANTYSSADYAQLFAVLDSSGQVVGAYDGTTSGLSTMPVTAANLANVAGTIASFYVELYNYSSGEALARSETVSYSDVSNYITDFRNGYSQMTANGAWVVNSFSAVPEPTSGLLMLLGLAGLALKRKRGIPLRG